MSYQIFEGHVLDRLREMSAESVDCVITSPPYWGLRDYGCEGQIGLEPTPVEFVAKMVEVFGEIRRVLSKSGSVWLNIGDTYAASGAVGTQTGKQGTNRGSDYKPGRRAGTFGFKQKDRCMIPARVAIALQEDGWWLRDEIIWAKPNPMPSSVTDRTTPAHEMVYLLTKSKKYYYDAYSIRTAYAEATAPRLERTNGGLVGNDAPGQTAHSAGRAYKMPDNRDTGPGGHGAFHREVREKGAPASAKGSTFTNGKTGVTQGDCVGQEERFDHEGANKRSVWTVASQPYPLAHFATYPEELIIPMVLAGCPEGGVILDPFLGSGTTIAVAIRYGRIGWGIELNPTYIELAHKRILAETPSLMSA